MAVTVEARYADAVDVAVCRRLVLAEQRAAAAATSPLAWATAHARVLDPLTGLQPFAPYPYQARLLEDRSPRRLVLKARQVGVSLTVALEALYYALQVPYLPILFVSRTQDLAQQLIAYAAQTLGNLTPAPVLVAASRSELAFANGSRLLSLPANPATGRGFPAGRLYLDEFAWLQYAQQVYDSATPAVAPGGSITVLSTPNGRSNLFFRLWQGLEGGAWSRHAVPWQDCPRYDDAWAAAKQAELTAESWAQEYGLDFLTSGGAVFDPDDLARAKVGHDPRREGCEKYITAWDIGRRNDWAVGLTLGLRDRVWHEVALERVREPYPRLQRRIEDRHAAYPGRHLVESNGIGDPVIENLTVTVDRWTTTAKTKQQGLDALKLLLQQRRFKYADPQLDRELGLYELPDDALVQDCVMAAAIAAHATGDVGWAFF